MSDVDRDRRRLAHVLGDRVTRQRLRQARDSQPEADEQAVMSEATADIRRNNSDDEQSNLSDVTISRRFRAEREGEISIDDPDFDQLRAEDTPRLNLQQLLGEASNTTPEVRTSSPVSNSNVLQLISSRNQARNGNMTSPTTQARAQGAIPRRRANDLQGLGSYTSRSEGRPTISPERAIDTNTNQGRFLLERMQRLEQQERLRDEQHAEAMRALHERHTAERQAWDQQMRALQQQLQEAQLGQAQGNLLQPITQAAAPPRMEAPQGAQAAAQADLTSPGQHIMIQPQAPPQPPYRPIQQPILQPNQPQQVQWRPQNPVQNQLGGQAHVNMAPQQQQLHPQYQVGQPPFMNFQTPYGGRTPGPGPDGAGWQHQRIDRKDLKLKLFKGEEPESFKQMWEDLAEALQWTEVEKKLQLKSHVADWIRPMWRNCTPQVTADEMMDMLINRFGKTLTATEVTNKLFEIRRKNGEDLYTLADRVRKMADKASFPPRKRAQLERDSFFAALQNRTELQHWVHRYDDVDQPDMYHTLQLAMQWEQQHGTEHRSERIRMVGTDESRHQSESSEWPDTTDNDTETSTNQVQFIDTKSLKSEELKIIARAHNKTVAALKKGARNVLEDDNADNKYKASQSSSYSSSRGSSRGYGNTRRHRSRSGGYRRSNDYRDRNKRSSRDRRPRDHDKRGQRRDNDKKENDKPRRSDRYDRNKRRGDNNNRVRVVDDDHRSRRSRTRSASASEDSRSRSASQSRSDESDKQE